MMTLESVFFANTKGLSPSQIERIQIFFDHTCTQIADLIPTKQTDVIIHVKPSWTIPEIGFSGFSPNAAYALIHIDPSNPKFDSNIEKELAATIAHELHHCARYTSVGYGQTLLEALVTEGLACVFEMDFRQGQLPIYCNALETSQISALLGQAQIEFHSRTYLHHDWFFGSQERGIPRWTGYTLGHEIVKHYLEKTGCTAASQWNTPASNFDRKDLYE